MADEIIVRTLSELIDATNTADAFIKLDKDIVIDDRIDRLGGAFSELDMQGHAIRSAFVTATFVYAAPYKSPLIKNGKILDMFVDGSNAFFGAYDQRTPLRLENVSVAINADNSVYSQYQGLIFYTSFNLCNVSIRHSSGLTRSLFSTVSATDSRFQFELENVNNGSFAGCTYNGCSLEGHIQGTTNQAHWISMNNSVFDVDTTHLLNAEGFSVSLHGSGIYNADNNPNIEAESRILSRNSDSILSPAFNNANGFPVEVV